jgi:predicted nucleic-acid-binding protein
MIGLDTNVLVRMIVRDDPVQTPVAARILEEAEEDGLFVSLVVLAEVASVLDRGYRYAPAKVFDAIARILEGREFYVEARGLAVEALKEARVAKCEYADALIALLGREGGASSTLTFDIRAKRLPTMRDAASFK